MEAETRIDDDRPSDDTTRDEPRNPELSDEELAQVSGGGRTYRITNVRVDATLGVGASAGSSPVTA